MNTQITAQKKEAVSAARKALGEASVKLSNLTSQLAQHEAEFKKAQDAVLRYKSLVAESKLAVKKAAEEKEAAEDLVSTLTAHTYTVGERGTVRYPSKEDPSVQETWEAIVTKVFKNEAGAVTHYQVFYPAAAEDESYEKIQAKYLEPAVDQIAEAAAKKGGKKAA